MNTAKKLGLGAFLMLASAAAALAVPPDPAGDLDTAMTGIQTTTYLVIALSITCAVAGLAIGFVRKGKR